PSATRLVKVLGRVEQPVDPVSELPQYAQLRQVFQHLCQVPTLGLGEVLSAFHNQITMLEHKVCPLLDRRPASPGSGLGLLALAAPFLLTAGLAPPAHGCPQPSHRT